MVESVKDRGVGCKTIKFSPCLHAGFFNPCTVVVKFSKVPLFEPFTDISPDILSGFKVYKLAITLDGSTFSVGSSTWIRIRSWSDSLETAVSIASGS